jgi:hypothetical protein
MFGNEEVEGTIFSSKWLSKNEDLAYKRKIKCVTATELRNTQKSLCKIRCKWENKISNI